jgi:hypothetical protein
MNRLHYLIRRCGYLEGCIATIELYAIWKDGERFMGVMREPLADALRPYQSELYRLNKEAEPLLTKAHVEDVNR